MKDMNIPYIAGLVIRAQHSDSDAFAELYALTYNKVYNYTRHYLRDDFLAQDAMQEVYILALKNIGKLNDPTVLSRIPTWTPIRNCTTSRRMSIPAWRKL